MQYIIMIAIVIMMALADVATGLIKAYVTGKPNSQKMRVGGLHKISEIVVMATACGLEIGIEMLGQYRCVAVCGSGRCVCSDQRFWLHHVDGDRQRDRELRRDQP